MRLFQNILNTFKMDNAKDSGEIVIHTDNSERDSYIDSCVIKLLNATTIDSLFVEAGKFVIEHNTVSIAMIQRFCKIGFNRAVRIIDQLVEIGIISEVSGTHPNEIFVTIQEFDEIINKWKNASRSYSHAPNAEHMFLTTIKAFWNSNPRRYASDTSDAPIEDYLLYGKILMLDLFTKAHPLLDKFPVYFQFECHLSNPSKLQNELLQNDYLEPASAYMVLASYRVPELKMLAESIGCSKNGKKQELIDRIYDALDSEMKQQLTSQSDLYVLSSKGQAFLAGNDDYIELHRHANYNIPLYEFNRNRFPDGHHRRTFNDNIYTLISERVYKNCVQRIFNGMERDHKILFDIAMSEYRYDIALDHYLRSLYLDSCCVNTAQYYASDYHMVEFNPDYEIVFTAHSAAPLIELAEYYSITYIETIYMDCSLPPSFLTQQEFSEMITEMIESTIFDYDKYNTLIASRLEQFSIL